MKKKVLFLCIHNSIRSQIAEALLDNLQGDRYEVRNAGVTPTKINQYVVTAMADIGIGISNTIQKELKSSGLKLTIMLELFATALWKAAPSFLEKI